jgi:hypothetical protein
MSEEGLEADIEGRRFNVAEVPEAEILAARFALPQSTLCSGRDPDERSA